MFHEYEEKKRDLLGDHIWVENHELISPNHLWMEAQRKFSRTEILNFIGDLIREHDLDFPFHSYHKENLIRDFKKKNSNPVRTL